MPRNRNRQRQNRSDDSPKNERRSEEKELLRDRPYKQLKSIKPRNFTQQTYLECIEKNTITIGLGPAGSGKTYLSVYEALLHHWAKDKKRMIITRPAIEAGEKLGFLPGDLSDKLDPYMRPIYDALYDIIGVPLTKEKIERGYIEIAPLAYMRGRAEPLTAVIPTPKGPKKMGEIRVGDYVYGSDGQPVRVTGVYPQGTKPTVDVVFDDGQVVRCSRDHLWDTRTASQRKRGKPFIAKSAAKIQESLRNKHGHKNHEIPVMSSPVFMFKQETPIDPYVLGCLLGDGTMTAGSIHFTTADAEILDLIQAKLPQDFTINLNVGSRSGYDYYITNKNLTGSSRSVVKTSLRNLRLWGCKAHEKFIPAVYLNNDADFRLALLRGLMDTDGSVYPHRSGKSRTEFYSVSQQLAKDVKFLVESLGGVARLRLRSKPKNGTHRSGFGHKYDCYTVDMILPATINPFLLKRKAALFAPSPLMRLISDVVDVGEEKCQCISVDAPDHLYLTGDFIVTHNTFNNCFIILDEAQNATLEQLKMVLTRVGENCKLVIDGDPGQSDLPGYRKQSGLYLLKDILRDTPDVGIIEFDRNDIVRSQVVIDIVKAFEEYENEHEPN